MISKLAKWEHVPTLDLGPRKPLSKALVLHTAVTAAHDLFSYYTSSGTDIGAHFYLDADGTLYQFVDTDRQCAHAYAANPWSIALESWDGGDPAHTPWTQAQLDTIDALCRELDIPGQALKASASDGVGYHSEYPAWTGTTHHTCPDAPRIAQVPGIIARLKKGGFLMALSDADQTNLANDAKAIRLRLDGLLSELGLPHTANIATDPAGNADLKAGQGLGALLKAVAAEVGLDVAATLAKYTT